MGFDSTGRFSRGFSGTEARVCPVKAVVVVVVVTAMHHVIDAEGFTLPPSSTVHFSGLCLFLWPSPSTRLGGLFCFYCIFNSQLLNMHAQQTLFETKNNNNAS